MTTKKQPKSASATEGVATEKKVRKPAARRTSTRKKKVEEPAEEAAAETPVMEVAAETDVVQTAAEVESKQEIAKQETAQQEPINIEQVTPEQTKSEQTKAEEVKPAKAEEPAKQEPVKPEPIKLAPSSVAVPGLPHFKVSSIVDLAQASQRSIVLTDQQIQQLTLEEVAVRHAYLQELLANVLDYDVVISDTNIWLELFLPGGHGDQRNNVRLQFERQLEFISKLVKHRGCRFMMMGETYEEIDRFATMQDPMNHKEADFSDNVVCLNTAARLAKRLILSQQRENRLRIEGLGAESHHASFADPVIIRKVVELFSEGKKVLLITNDASVAIRSMGLCDDLQRINGVADDVWDSVYAPLRPMVFTFDDLKLLDNYTRQYHYIQMASSEPWMCGVGKRKRATDVAPLALWLEAFRPGDKHRGDNLFTDQEMQLLQKKEQQKLQTNQQKQQANNQPKQGGGQQQKHQKQQKQQANNQPKQGGGQQKQNANQPKQEVSQPKPNEEVVALPAPVAQPAPVVEAVKEMLEVSTEASVAQEEAKPASRTRRKPSGRGKKQTTTKVEKTTENTPKN